MRVINTEGLQEYAEQYKLNDEKNSVIAEEKSKDISYSLMTLASVFFIMATLFGSMACLMGLVFNSNQNKAFLIYWWFVPGISFIMWLFSTSSISKLDKQYSAKKVDFDYKLFLAHKLTTMELIGRGQIYVEDEDEVTLYFKDKESDIVSGYTFYFTLQHTDELNECIDLETMTLYYKGTLVNLFDN